MAEGRRSCVIATPCMNEQNMPLDHSSWYRAYRLFHGEDFFWSSEPVLCSDEDVFHTISPMVNQHD